jgi:glycolate oxidase iron-sulfur subunit
LSREDLLLPGPTPRRRTFKNYYPPLSAPQGEVSLFLGCLSQISLHDLFHDSILLLQQLGYGVHVPLKQACCGGLFQHTGHLKQAQKCQEQNQSVFTELKGIPMLTFATGCQRDLKDTHPESMDIMSFLATISWPTNWHCAPLAKTFVIQTPCSTHAAEKAAVYSLLTKIPNIRLENLPYSQCCGAAGIQMLTNPAQSDALGLAWLQEMQKIPGITGVVTTNIGCQMHLARLSRQNRSEISFLHPLSLFLTQLNRKERTFPLDKTTQ